MGHGLIIKLIDSFAHSQDNIIAHKIWCFAATNFKRSRVKHAVKGISSFQEGRCDKPYRNCPLQYAYAMVDFAAYAGHFTIWVTFEFVSKFDLLMATPAFKYNPQ